MGDTFAITRKADDYDVFKSAWNPLVMKEVVAKSQEKFKDHGAAELNECKISIFLYPANTTVLMAERNVPGFIPRQTVVGSVTKASRYGIINQMERKQLSSLLFLF